MPIIASARKRMRQAVDKTRRNHARKSEMRSLYRNILALAKSGETDKAQVLMPRAYKSIDLCAKNNLIHKNNAARKKSNIARALATPTA